MRLSSLRFVLPEIMTVKPIPLILLVVAAALLVGCDSSALPTNVPIVDTAQKSAAEAAIPTLGDQIAALSNADATELTAYLSDIHGILPVGQQAQADDNRRQKDSFDVAISTLGDQIASLSLADSVSLSEYLSEHHGIAADK